MEKFKAPTPDDYKEAIAKMNSKDKDIWESSIYVKNVGIAVPLGMYFYCMPECDIQVLSSVIGNCNAIHSCYLSPFINITNTKCFQVRYDTKRFGKSVGAIVDNPKLYRIESLSLDKLELGKFKKCKHRFNKHSDIRCSENESRLYNFPYSYALLTDYMNTPLEIRYNLCKTPDNYFKVICDSMISDKGSYMLAVENYKFDESGTMEGMSSTAPTEIPVSSSAYASWSSTQKAQTNQQLINNLATFSQANQFTQESVSMQGTQLQDRSKLDQIGNVAGMLGSLLSLNLGGIAQGGMNILRTAQQTNQGLENLNMQSDHAHRNFELAQRNAIGMKNAQIKDIQNTPRTMMSTGSDVLFSLKKSESKIDLIRYSVDYYNKERLALYFAMFGYKINRVIKIDIRSRIDYNYIKTVGCNIVSRKGGRRIPKDHLRKLSEIFDSGITFWHVTRGHKVFQDYTYENYEYEVWKEINE